jgi:hypothetical protein
VNHGLEAKVDLASTNNLGDILTSEVSISYHRMPGRHSH